jgi:tRNA 2-thiouridine synthesizing protein B
MTSNTLHIINKSASDSQLYRDCLDSLHKDDAIILIESAVYTACESGQNTLGEAQVPVYALKTDIQARGVLDKIHHQIEIIDDAEFVTLCCNHQKSVSWF